MIADFLRKLFNGHKTKGAAITAPFYYSKNCKDYCFCMRPLCISLPFSSLMI
jgi:hypothetical protein